MSKMDRQLNSKKDKDTIYEIYRACRLCGAGAGYKMPIIQNVIDLDDSDVELRQKVRDCVQIEVHQDDKMPPLICELCVDKVNDFYEFLEMCRQTNKRTRLKLGLPPQSMPRGAPDAGDCILGLAEPVYVNEDSDGEPLSKQRKAPPPPKVKREPELKVKLEKRVLTESRSTRFKRSPTPPRVTRNRTSSKEDNVSISRLKEKSKSPKVAPKSILKKETRSSKSEDSSLLSPRLKRSREPNVKEPVKVETPVKKVKIAPKPSSPPKPSPKTSPRVPPRPPPRAPARAPSPPRVYKCAICGQANKTPQANSNHLRSHVVNFTSEKLACNACCLWFSTIDEATSHHRAHNKLRPYTCRHCAAHFRQRQAYADHIENNECLPFDEVPDVKCDVCWHLFATNKLLEDHRCLGEDHRPGGKCGKCNRSYALLKNLKKHELTCTAKKKGDRSISPSLLASCSPVQVRVSRCDPLLQNIKQAHYDVSRVTPDFGLDKNCIYPYISVSSLRIKSDPESLDRMVAINHEIKEEFFSHDYVHWDSEEESDEEATCSLVLNPVKKKNVDSLANLTLKTLFSKKCLGKVPKKRRRVKQEKSLFDSLLGEADDDVTKDINNIIDNLGEDDDLDNSQKVENGEIEKDVSFDDTNKIDVSDVDSSIVDENAEIKDKSSVANDDSAQSVKISENLSDVKDDDSAANDFNSENNETRSNYNLNNDVRTDGEVDGTINNLSDNDDVSKKGDSNVNLEGKDENQNDGVANDDFDAENDAAETRESYSVSDVLNDSTQSDVGSETEKEIVDNMNIINDNATSLPDQNSDVDEKSQNNDISQKENQGNDIQREFSQGNDENEIKNSISVIVNNSSNKEEDIDDSKLMEALNAQIGDGNDHRGQVMDKMALDDLISGKSQGMDGIPEEFNFDA